jgi:hypothetical protein
MKRSPFSTIDSRTIFTLTILALLFLTTAVYGQSPSTAPKQASGTPDAPVAGTQASGPSKTNAPANIQTPVQTATSTTDNSETSQQPKTEILDSSATSAGVLSTDGHDPILDPPPLPGGKTSLVGGVVSDVDQIRNRMTVAVFGGGHWKVGFDERTHIFRGGAETTQLAIKKGERVSVDTMLDSAHHEVFARNIRLGVAALPADVDGQIIDVDSNRRIVVLRDKIGASPVHFSVDQSTKITHGTRPASLNELKPGSLVRVQFSPQRPNRGLAREIAIIAAPGSVFTFVGKITYLDMHRGILALQNLIDDKNYEIHFNSTRTDAKDSLAVGTEVRIVATFDGPKYTAQTITLTKPPE